MRARGSAPSPGTCRTRCGGCCAAVVAWMTWSSATTRAPADGQDREVVRRRPCPAAHPFHEEGHAIPLYGIVPLLGAAHWLFFSVRSTAEQIGIPIGCSCRHALYIISSFAFLCSSLVPPRAVPPVGNVHAPPGLLAGFPSRLSCWSPAWRCSDRAR